MDDVRYDYDPDNPADLWENITPVAPEDFIGSCFTCPRCFMVSHNKNDIREGYCGNCHDWTGVRQ